MSLQINDLPGQRDNHALPPGLQAGGKKQMVGKYARAFIASIAVLIREHTNRRERFFAGRRPVRVIAHFDHPQPAVFVEADRDRVNDLGLARHEFDRQARLELEMSERVFRRKGTLDFIDRNCCARRGGKRGNRRQQAESDCFAGGGEIRKAWHLANALNLAGIAMKLASGSFRAARRLGGEYVDHQNLAAKADGVPALAEKKRDDLAPFAAMGHVAVVHGDDALGVQGRLPLRSAWSCGGLGSESAMKSMESRYSKSIGNGNCCKNDTESDVMYSTWAGNCTVEPRAAAMADSSISHVQNLQPYRCAKAANTIVDCPSPAQLPGCRLLPVSTIVLTFRATTSMSAW